MEKKERSIPERRNEDGVKSLLLPLFVADTRGDVCVNVYISSVYTCIRKQGTTRDGCVLVSLRILRSDWKVSLAATPYSDLAREISIVLYELFTKLPRQKGVVSYRDVPFSQRPVPSTVTNSARFDLHRERKEP